MREYPKINTAWMRDDKGRIVLGQWANPTIAYLANNVWLWTEKIDGMNTRINLTTNNGGDYSVEYGGRTEPRRSPPSSSRTLTQCSVPKLWRPGFVTASETTQR